MSRVCQEKFPVEAKVSTWPYTLSYRTRTLAMLSPPLFERLIDIPTVPLPITISRDHAIPEVVRFKDLVEAFYELGTRVIAGHGRDEIHELIQVLSDDSLKQRVQIADQPIPPHILGRFARDTRRDVVTDHLEMLRRFGNLEDQALERSDNSRRDLRIVERAVLIGLVVRELLAKGHLS